MVSSDEGYQAAAKDAEQPRQIPSSSTSMRRVWSSSGSTRKPMDSKSADRASSSRIGSHVVVMHVEQIVEQHQVGL